MVDLPSRGTSILFCIAAALFYIPTNIEQGFQFLHIFADTWNLLFCFVFFFIITIPTGARSYLIVSFICKSLIISDVEKELRKNILIMITFVKSITER